MTATTHQAYEASNATRSVAESHPLRRLQSVVAELIGLCDRQRQRYALLELDSRLLEDIGKSRADAAAEGRKPFWR